jgi:serine/threonine protein kinase
MEVDGKPVPRIIDFGLAKPTMPQLDGETFTQLGHFVGTPGYMSPEQADSSVEDIDTPTCTHWGQCCTFCSLGSQPFETKPGEKLQVLLENPKKPSCVPSCRTLNKRPFYTSNLVSCGARSRRSLLTWIDTRTLSSSLTPSVAHSTPIRRHTRLRH